MYICTWGDAATRSSILANESSHCSAPSCRPDSQQQTRFSEILNRSKDKRFTPRARKRVSVTFRAIFAWLSHHLSVT